MSRTILVTGASGYIAKHIVAGLLNAGYAVTGSARSTWRDAEIRAALRPALDEFRPEGILISAGFDAHRDDPLAGIYIQIQIPANIVDFAGGRIRKLSAAVRVGSCFPDGFIGGQNSNRHFAGF